MIIIGHKLGYEYNFIKIQSKEKITNHDNYYVFTYNENLMLYCKKNDIKYATFIQNEQEAILSNAANASFVISENLDLLKIVQNIANEYLFDCKILYLGDIDDIKKIASNCIDGLILKEAIHE